MDGKGMTKLGRAVDGVLAVFLIGLIFLFGFKTIYPNFKRLYDAARLMKKLEVYLPEDYGALDLLSARIRSFEAAFDDSLWMSEELGYLNADIQYALGKDMITTGAANMLKLPSGDLYDLQGPKNITPQIDEIIRFAGEADVPLTYIYAHPTNYDVDKLTGGYAQLDLGDEMGDQIVNTLRGAGIDVIDSRVALEGIPASKIVLRTDQHWTPYAALETARALAGALGLDGSLLDPAVFETETYQKKFFGKYGQRIGADRVTPDDFTVLWPTYETEITRYTLNNGTETEVTGSFRDAVIKWDSFEGEGWSIIAYKAYGLTEDFEHYHNEAAPDVSVLIYKDSYGAPVGAFLSLAARDVYLVDMRKTDKEATEFIDELKPDQVVIAYSRQMLVLDEYDLFHDE